MTDPAHLELDNEKVLDPEAALLAWYKSLCPLSVDLVGDYAGQELFLVEGDSLLLECFNDSKIDFGYGFQLLHATYAIENFLQNLVRRKCNFHIAFFDKNQHLCVPSNASSEERTKYLLARSVVIRHLTQNLKDSYPRIEIHIFHSIHDSTFTDYLSSAGVYFVLCHDGAQSTQSSTKASQPNDVTERQSRARSLVFRSMIWWFISHGFNVALIGGLEWKDTKVMTMVVEGARLKGLSPETLSDGYLSARETLSSSHSTSLDLSGVFDRLSLSKPPVDTTNLASGTKPANDSILMEKIQKIQSFESDGHALFTERICLTVVVLFQMLLDKPEAASQAAVFLLHSALIAGIPISCRRVAIVDTASPKSNGDEATDFMVTFAAISTSIICQPAWKQAMNSLGISCDVADLLDGRLFRMLLYTMQDDHALELVPSPIRADFDSLANALLSLTGTQPKLQHSPDFRKQSVPVINGHGEVDKKARYCVLPFSNAVFDKHLAPIRLTLDSSVTATHPGVPAKIFREVTHWNNAKRPLVSKKPPPAVSEKTQKRALRSNQFYMADMTVYAASLTNSAGKMLEPELITVVRGKKGHQASSGDKRHERKGKAEGSDGSSTNSGKSHANPGKKVMLSNIAAQRDLKENDAARKLLASWQKKRELLDGVADPKAKYIKTKDYLNDLVEGKRSVLETEVKLFMVQSLLDIWVRSGKEGTKQKDYATAALIWDTLRNFSSVKSSLTATVISHIEKVTKLLGTPLPKLIPTTADRKLSFVFAIPVATPEVFSVALPPKEFQLLQCGPYMDRNVDSAPDPRVPFEPDGWQRKVLDEIDANRSVFVVAPTSAGKTFISFYAMEQTLRGDDNGILVYVAPTKALVNQIAAEIQSRFKKSYDYPGKSVWAIHTRDYRIHNPMGCQVLVTVPHVLQIMLLAPTNANSWSSRVKRIIFDEIHSIGQAEDGVVWEQLLLLAPCPIIALSATVGNPEQFNSWLASTQRSSNFDLTMITHASRYSDLRKFMYIPPKRFAFKGLPDRSSFARLGLDNTPGFAFVHPVASLVNRSRGMPDDLTLEARDCLTLWQAMTKYQTSEYPVEDALDPANALPSVIKKIDVTRWEQNLKSLLRRWMSDMKSPFEKVLKTLSEPMLNPTAPDVQISRGSLSDATKEEIKAVDPEDFFATTLPMLASLHERDALPAILFNYDRSKCENIALAVSTQLKAHEKEWKESSPKWKSLLKGWEAWKKMNENKKLKRPVKTSASKKGRADDEDPASKADQAKDSANEEQNQYETFDPEAPQDMFTFADKRKFQASDLAHYFWQLERKGVAPWLMEALTRGIGVHHAGMNRKYRQIVEILFRRGYLRVVIATGTLALGINMPCATVVFSGDSVFLTALNFRQAAGRAGRRGFDLLGNVVFQGISPDKASRLLSSRLPDLNGHFPITTTLVLRLFILLHDSGTSQYASKAIHSLLSQPRLYLGGDSFKDQVLHHLRFSIEYLRRQGLLGADGAPQNFAGCISHLYFTENSSFAFHALLKEGYFHELCADIDTKESSILEQLMLIMAHLFGRRPCRQADQEYSRIVKESSSVVFLPPLPAKASAVLRKHNQETLEIFTTYVKTFADEHMKDEDRELPLTGLKAGGQTEVTEFGAFPHLPQTKTRSAFVALSGHGDTFESVSDLCGTARQGIFLEKAIIPHLDVYPDESKSPLNAYLYDFFKHGDVTQLAKANGIRTGEVWFLLNDFSLILATIIASLSVFMKLSSGSELDMLDVIGNGDVAENLQDGDLAEAENKTPEPLAATNASRQPAKKSTTGKRAKVADDWETAEQQAVADDAAKAWAAEGLEDGSAASGDARGERGLMQVLKALQRLKTEFDITFKKMWA